MTTYVCKLIALYTANMYIAERKMSASACTRSMPGFNSLISVLRSLFPFQFLFKFHCSRTCN